MSSSTGALSFPGFLHQPIQVSFDAPEITSDAGWLLLAQLDREMGLTERLAGTLIDERDPAKVRHDLLTQLRQRVYQIAAGHEDCNDADTLRQDPLLKAVLGQKPSGEDLASQPTLSRFENGRCRKELFAMADALLEHFIESRKSHPPSRVVLDLDGTEDEVHGQQHFAYFNGYAGHYCFFPLVVTATCDQEREQIPLCVVLRPGKAHAARGTLALLRRLLPRLRAAFPRVQVQVRLDGGFAQPEIYEWLEAQGVDYFINLPQNTKLRALAESLMLRARVQQKRQGGTITLFGQVCYRAKSWKKARRVIVKAEVTPQGDNPRFLVTNVQQGIPEKHYRFYTQRGDFENRIKELKQLQLDRTSCHRFSANQFRLFLHLTAFLLWQEMRRRLRGTDLARAQVDRLILRLMKAGAWVRETARGLRVRLSKCYAYQRYWFCLALYWQPVPD